MNRSESLLRRAAKAISRADTGRTHTVVWCVRREDDGWPIPGQAWSAYMATHFYAHRDGRTYVGVRVFAEGRGRDHASAWDAALEDFFRRGERGRRSDRGNDGRLSQILASRSAEELELALAAAGAFEEGKQMW